MSEVEETKEQETTEETQAEEVITAEVEEPEETESAEGGELDRLKEENAALNKRVLRAHADLENFKKRSERDRQDAIKFGNRTIFLQILDVLDNFDRAMTSAPDPNDNFVIGVNMIQKQLVEVLTQNGVEEINAMGRPFDPYLDEAIAKEVTTEHDENTVIEVFQKGFRYQGQLLRAGKVKVAAAPEPESAEADEASEEQVES